MAKKRQVSAKTKVKLSQAAKKRRRGPKGSAYGGRFMAGFTPALGHSHAAMGGPSPGGKTPRDPGSNPADVTKGLKGLDRPGDSSNNLFASHYSEKKLEYQKKGMNEQNAHEAAMEKAYEYAYNRTGMRPDISKVNAPLRIFAAERQQAKQVLMDAAIQKEGTDYRRKTRKEYFDKLPEEEKAQFEDPKSELRRRLSEGIVSTGSQTTKQYGSPGERDRQTKYFRARSQGLDQEAALKVALEDRRGQRIAGGVTKSDLNKDRQRRSQRTGISSGARYRSQAPKPGELSFGIDAPAVSSLTTLEKRYPNLTQTDYIKLQEADKQVIFEEFLKNRAWAHETRLAKLQGGASTEGPDRISVFTTSLGHPNVTVPSDSLVGQYVVKRRRDLAQKEGIARGAQLRGTFPGAIRDLHIIELSTGTKLGVEGTTGVYHQTGWRAGAKKSRGYGKPTPVGSSVLRDSLGQPIYDSEGNIRYTEGVTRPFRISSKRELGLRVFIG